MRFKINWFIHKLQADKKIRIWLWIGFTSLFLGAFLVVTTEVQEAAAGHPELIGVIDNLPSHFLSHIRNPRLNGIAVDLTALGSGTVVALFVLATAILMSFRKRYFQILHLLVATLGSAILTVVMKFYFERPRPEASMRLVHVDGYSYPSGHSLVSAALYFTFAIFLCQDFNKPVQRTLIIGFSLIFIFLIATSRVYLGAHYISDVIAGVLLGVGWASLLGVASTYFQIRRDSHDAK